MNPSGRIAWVARYTNASGERVSAGTFELRGPCKRARPDGQCCAQHAIWHAYKAPAPSDTVGSYLETWLVRHPRSERTNRTNRGRIRAVLDAKVEGRALRDWPLRELQRRHARDLVHHMLVEQKRAHTGAQNILRSLSAMVEDAIEDQVADENPFRRVTVRANDPRVVGRQRPPQLFELEEMRAFAVAGGRWEPMLRVFTDCGLRLGEVLPLERGDLVDGWVRVLRTAHRGKVLQGTKTDHGEASAGRAVPLSRPLVALVGREPVRLGTDLLFPTPTGLLWRENNFYERVWWPTREKVGLAIRPQDCRHSWVSHMRASGVDDADLARWAGHTVQTMLGVYTHALERSYGAAMEALA